MLGLRPRVTGERAAVAGYEVRGLDDESAILRDAFGGFEIEAHARMNASLAKVAVDDAVVAVAIAERVEVAKISAELVWRDSSILPAGPRLDPAARHPRCTEPALAHQHRIVLVLFVDQ